MYETILSPVEIGGLTLKNRIVFAPTSLGLKGEELEQKITAIAEGGCAMIIIGDVPVSDRGFFRLSGKKGFAHYKRLCELIHAAGSLACAQLHQSDSDVKGMLRYIPACSPKDYGRGTSASAESADRQIYYTAVLSEGIGHYIILRESGLSWQSRQGSI